MFRSQELYACRLFFLSYLFSWVICYCIAAENNGRITEKIIRELPLSLHVGSFVLMLVALELISDRLDHFSKQS